MRRIGIVTLSICGCLFLAPLGASATTIQYLGIAKGAAVTISLNDPANNAVVWSGLGVTAGEQSWQFTGTPLPGYNPTFYAYCVDAMHYLQNSEDVTLKSTDLLVVTNVPDAGKKAAWLFNTYAPTIHTSGSSTESAALQVAIWEALYDTTADLSGGKFRMSNNAAVTTKALEYLTALYIPGGGYNTSTGSWLDTLAGQDLEVITPGPGTNAAVPEPSTLALCGIGLLGVLRAIRQRKQQRKSAAQQTVPLTA